MIAMADQKTAPKGGVGVVTHPQGITQEEAERLCREADEQRKADR